MLANSAREGSYNRNGNPGSGNADAALDGVITYKRRKRTAATVTVISEDMKEPNGTVLRSSNYEQDVFARVDHNWRSVLQKMMQVADVSEGGSIQRCILNALSSGTFCYNQNVPNISPDIAKPEVQSRCKSHIDFQGNLEKLHSPADGSVGFRYENYGEADLLLNTKKCQNIFGDILRSEKFALLCDLLRENFHEGEAISMTDFSLINLKMKKGAYEKSSSLFGEDILEVWKKYQKIGQEMVLLANGLIDISRASYQKQVGKEFVYESIKQKCEETCHLAEEQKNSTESCTVVELPSYASEPSTKPDQTEASFLYKVLTCKQCSNQADGQNSLICDGCEAMFHVSCAEPVVQGIPTRSWYCTSCTITQKKLSENGLKDGQQDGVHQSCVVCDRLDFTDAERHVNRSDVETEVSNDLRESSVASMDSEEPLEEPSRTAMLRLCKQCGSCEDEDKRFLVCGNTQCLYKFYHIRCLKTSQIACQQQLQEHCWYCPSCLCRGCLTDKDDEKIVMCDGCDEAYHTYCMKPPRTSIPKGNWYCTSCNAKRAKEGMKRYEEFILQQLSQKSTREISGTKRSVDMLLSAAKKLSAKERSVH